MWVLNFTHAFIDNIVLSLKSLKSKLFAPFVYLSIHLFTCLCICLFICLFIPLIANVFIYMFTNLLIYWLIMLPKEAYSFQLCMWFCFILFYYTTKRTYIVFSHMTFDWNSSAVYENGHRRSHVTTIIRGFWPPSPTPPEN